MTPSLAAPLAPFADALQVPQQPVTLRWRNHLDEALSVVVTTAPNAANASDVPVHPVPGLSGGMPDKNAAVLAAHTVVIEGGDGYGR